MHDPINDFRNAVISALGHAPDNVEPGRMHRFGTSGKRGDTAGWCKLFADLRGGVYGCHRQGFQEVWAASDRGVMTPHERAELARQIAVAAAEREELQRRHWAENAERIARMWNNCAPLVPGDPVTLYLKRRGFAGLWPIPKALRYHRCLPYWHEGEKLGEYPAMVAPLVNMDGQTVALHRTYLTADGRKADVPQAKKLTGAAGRLNGSAIPLFGPHEGALGIAEGIETALAAWCASGVPAVAAYSAGNLASWRWPTDLRRLLIFADADQAGRKAAAHLCDRATNAGLSCEIFWPSTEGEDWCDVWARRSAEEVHA